MQRLFDGWHTLAERLEGAGRWIAPLGLRLLLAWEFFEAGREKLFGSNWFERVRDDFPFPFDTLPVELSWMLATWSELALSIALAVGFATRFAAFGLFVLTAVAIAAVHWPGMWGSLAELGMGYSISDEGFGNYKLPLIFMVMLLPLVFGGGGRLSVDTLLARLARTGPVEPNADATAFGIAALVVGLPMAMLLPTLGLTLVAAGVALVLLARWLAR